MARVINHCLNSHCKADPMLVVYHGRKEWIGNGHPPSDSWRLYQGCCTVGT